MGVDLDESRMEVDDRADGMEENDHGNDGEKPRESGRHRSKDKKDRDRSSKDRERSKERERDDYKGKDSDRLDSRERDAVDGGRKRKREDRSEHEKDRGSARDKTREREKEKDYDHGKHRDKERDIERGKDRGKERDRDREPERGRERGKERDTEHERERGKERGKEREKERDKEREKAHGHARDQDRDRERDKDRDRGHDRSKARERDLEEARKESERDRGKGREREREKDRDRAKDWEREKDRSKDREEKEKNRERDKTERISTKSGVEHKERETDKANERTSSDDHDEKPLPSGPTSDLEERLMKVKEERLKKNSDGASEILSWVSKTRKLQEKRNVEKEKMERLSKALEEQDDILAESEEDEEAIGQSTKDLAGVRILHGLDKVIEGGAVILTLKDQNILADGDINEDADMLENVEIGEQKQRDQAYKAAKKKTGIYTDKFNDDMTSQKTMLPQYDDPIEDEGVTLDEGGRFTGEAEKKLEELRRRIQGGSFRKTFEDLTSAGKISSDYYTPDEMVQFKKPKKKKSLRKKDKLDLNALEAEAVSAGLGVGDLGSRRDSKRQFVKEEQERTEAEMRKNAYLSAYAKADEASKALRLEQTQVIKSVEEDELVFGEDYEDLQRSLEQSRKLSLKRQEEAAPSGPQAVALLAVANKDQGDIQVPSAVEPQEDKVVITEMEEFVLGLQLNEETHKPESEDVFMDEDDMAKPYEHETKAEMSAWTEVKELDKDEPANAEKEDVAADEIIHEVPIGKGLAGAFKILRDRGTLNEGIDWGGRNMDKKKSKLVGIYDTDGSSSSKKKTEDPSAPRSRSNDTNASRKRNDEVNAPKWKHDEPKEIHIERTDEYGRIMTPKEAFRVLSHKFHGKGPGKMKQEKRMKQYQEDLKTKRMESSDTPSHTMERMREAQARMKTPYLVLSGNVKPGQTSDPRSGFATVEKDHLGSLTPMLGNRKVELFLGIRKPDSDSMGPPPPKKPKN